MVVNKMYHPLHKIIGAIFENSKFLNCDVIKDLACGGNQHIPLFCSTDKSNQTKYCNVDLLILKNNKVRIIVEIEEANIKPTQICGKFLTPALSSYFIHRTRDYIPILMDDSVSFIQILDTSKLKLDETSKINQWTNLEKSIQDIIPVKNSKINDYKLFFGNPSNFRDGTERKEFIDYIKKILK